MVYIISKSKSRRFKPHFNRATDRYYGTEKEYTEDLKRRGLEPYDPSKVKKPQSKPYTPSKWAHDMIEAKKQANGKVGDVWKKEIQEKANLKPPPEFLKGKTKGGIHSEDLPIKGVSQ